MGISAATKAAEGYGAVGGGGGSYRNRWESGAPVRK
jgi:hypothetical protein